MRGAETLADELTDVARGHVAAGRGHMTWAECVVWLRRQAEAEKTRPHSAQAEPNTTTQGEVA